MASVGWWVMTPTKPDSPRDLAYLLPATWRGRRRAVANGELARMWPGIVADLAAMVWWRGVYHPIVARLARRRGGGS